MLELDRAVAEVRPLQNAASASALPLAVLPDCASITVTATRISALLRISDFVLRPGVQPVTLCSLCGKRGRH